ncbi:MAG: DDE-type integrase/transposase/recombinase [Nanoarchaeota archaeon]|nr:DDE-type integrase/transposase/recombinase [Nanoarchaeota archaeon]
MKKELVRKEFFKLKQKGHSYSQCSKILYAKYSYEVSSRTLQRWMNRLDYCDNWNLKDESRRTKTIHYKLSEEIENKIVSLRNKTGWGENKIINYVEVGHWAVNKILNKHKLVDSPKRKKKRIKYIRFQRKHPNSLWQIDHSDQKVGGKWVLSIVDDCSRYSIAMVAMKSVTTDAVIKVIDDAIEKYGNPKQILTDNGSAYGSKSKHSRFDRQLKRRGIKHIRGTVHSPTTQGKVGRLFQTFKREFKFYNGDVESWRMNYNHFRPHESLENKTPDEIYNDFNKLF